MVIKKYIINDFQVEIFPSAKLNYYNSNDFYEELLDFYDEAYSKIKINFNYVESIDCSIIGKIIAFNKKVEKINCKVVISNVKNNYVKKY